jgi:hypothetical protein
LQNMALHSNPHAYLTRTIWIIIIFKLQEKMLMINEKWKRSGWNLVDLNSCTFLELQRKQILWMDPAPNCIGIPPKKYPNLNINISQTKWQCLRFISWIETNQN